MRVKTINGYVAVIVLGIFFCQNCATIFRGTSQKIPVTCSPSGARVFVDGEDVGITPFILKLKRKGSYVIRIEKPGYTPVQLALNRESNSVLPILGNMFIGGYPGMFLGYHLLYSESNYSGDSWFSELGDALGAAMIGFLLGWLAAILVDVGTGANYILKPESVVVQLAEREEGLGALSVSVERIENGPWIRISCQKKKNN